MFTSLQVRELNGVTWSISSHPRPFYDSGVPCQPSSLLPLQKFSRALDSGCSYSLSHVNTAPKLGWRDFPDSFFS